MSIYVNNQEYKIIKKLGEGRLGKVFQVLNVKDDKYYAIKTISFENLTKDELETIEQEKKILSSIIMII